MSLVKPTSIPKYWLTDPLYDFGLARAVMSRNRFELLLSNLHFANNETIEEDDRLGKILSLFDALIQNYQEMFLLGENFMIDETIIP